MKPGSYSCVCCVWSFCWLWSVTIEQSFPCSHDMQHCALWCLMRVKLMNQPFFLWVLSWSLSLFFSFFTCQPIFGKPAQDTRVVFAFVVKLVPCTWSHTQSHVASGEEPWKHVWWHLPRSSSSWTHAGLAPCAQTHLRMLCAACEMQDPKQAPGPHHWSAVQGRCIGRGGLCHRKSVTGEA